MIEVAKWPRRGAAPLPSALRTVAQREDVTHTVVTRSGEVKRSGWRALLVRGLTRNMGRRTVEIEDLASDFGSDPTNNLLAWDEVS